MNPPVTSVPAGVDALYRATTTPRRVVVPLLRFICADGRGDPETNPDYAAAIQALYSVAYSVKYALRAAGGPVLRISPLEGLWWSDDPSAFAAGQRSTWNWTLMLRVPPEVTSEIFERQQEQVATSRSMPAARRLRLMEFEEGPAAQVLHVGPYDAEGPTITALHEFLRAGGHPFERPGLRHHEIYLGDPRRCPVERLRTIIRQPYDSPEKDLRP